MPKKWVIAPYGDPTNEPPWGSTLKIETGAENIMPTPPAGGQEISFAPQMIFLWPPARGVGKQQKIAQSITINAAFLLTPFPEPFFRDKKISETGKLQNDKNPGFLPALPRASKVWAMPSCQCDDHQNGRPAPQEASTKWERLLKIPRKQQEVTSNLILGTIPTIHNCNEKIR